MKNQASSNFDAIGKRFNQMETKMAELAKVSTSQPFQEARRIDDLFKQVNSAIDTVNLLEKAKTKQVEDLKKGLKANMDALAKEIDQESATLSLTLKNYKLELGVLLKAVESARTKYHTLKQESESFNKDKVRIDNSIRAASTSFNDAYFKERQELEKRSADFANLSDSLNKKISGIKAEFGDASKLMDRIREAKGELQSMTKQVDDSKTEVSKLLDDLKALPTLTNLTPEQKTEAIERISQQSNASSEKLMKLKDGIKKTAKKLNEVGQETQA